MKSYHTDPEAVIGHEKCPRCLVTFIGSSDMSLVTKKKIQNKNASPFGDIHFLSFSSIAKISIYCKNYHFFCQYHIQNII